MRKATPTTIFGRYYSAAMMTVSLIAVLALAWIAMNNAKQNRWAETKHQLSEQITLTRQAEWLHGIPAAQSEELLSSILQQWTDSGNIGNEGLYPRLLHTHLNAPTGQGPDATALQVACAEHIASLQGKQEEIERKILANKRLNGGLITFSIIWLIGMTLLTCFGFQGILARKAVREQRELMVDNNELRKVNADLEEMSRMMAHDLKAPLRTVGSFAQLLKQSLAKPTSAESQEYLGFIINGTQRMSELLDAIMNHARLSSKKDMADKVILDEVMDEVKMNLYDSIVRNKAKVFTFELPVIHANKYQMTQVLQNLVENAIKYNKNDSPEIVIKGEEREKDFLVSVSDNGIGIPAHAHDLVFEVFHRLHPFEYEGTGVGLATCKKIIERHNGKIWIKSNDNQGSTFFFSIPKSQQKKRTFPIFKWSPSKRHCA